MNRNSKICCFITEHEDWREILKDEYGITVKEEPPLAIFNYGIECDFHNPIVQEARGIIIDTEQLEVVCWPFRKFGNYNESYADTIDWKTARVQDKIDGSIIKLWYRKDVGRWQFSTNSVINADKAVANSMTGETFEDIIWKANGFDAIDICIAHHELNENYTYIFELVSPETQVVVKYPEAKLYHIGTRDNITGEEKIAYIDVEHPKEYPLRSLDDCMNAVVRINQSEDGKVHDVKKEGFVVVDDNWNRIKIKSPDYLMLHRMSSNANFSKERIVGMIREKSVSVNDICNDFPNFAHYFKYYDFKISELEYQAKVFVDLTKRLFEEYQHDRKVVAMLIRGHRLAPIGFMCLDSGKTGKEILEEMPLARYCKYIPDYEPERLSELFYKRIK